MSTSPPHALGFAMAGGSGGEKVQVRRSGVFQLTDLRDAQERTLIHNLERLWLAQEIEKRRAEGHKLGDGSLRRALIVLPPDKESQVFINKEVHIQCDAHLRYPAATRKHVGEDVFPDEFEDICDTRLPQVAEHDGFLLLTYEAGTYYLVFDAIPCYPNIPVPLPPAEVRKAVFRELACLMAESLFGQCFRQPQEFRSQMLEDGWWPALCLLPGPYLQMAAAYEAGQPEQANRIAAEYLTPERIRTVADHWWSVSQFADQRTVVEQGLNAFHRGDHAACVRTLVPSVEGIVARAGVRGRLQTSHIPERVRGLASGQRGRYLPEKAADEFITYLEARFLTRFAWTDSDVDRAEGRHAVAHGAQLKYDHADALQIIVALDSLYRILRPVPSGWVAEKPDASTE